MNERPVAFITGAAHGQGRAVALALAGQGYDVAALDVAAPLDYPGYGMGTLAELLSLRCECAELGAACEIAVADVRDDAAVKAAVTAAANRFGRIDLLFNNAGICAYGLAHELTEPEWDAMIDINLKGAWIVGRHVIPHMIEAGRGSIVNNWAIELAPHGIRVNSIHPTGVDTPLNDGLAAMEGMTTQEIAERSAGNLLPVPWIEAEDVAAAVLYLAGDGARYVTGTTLVIDAGLLTR